MTKQHFNAESCFVLKPAARLEWKSFFACNQVQLNWNREQKRLGTEGGNSCPNKSNHKLLKIIVKKFSNTCEAK
ncbi:hypothetical protein AXA65_16680 [Chryseobacterium sp. FP211-J200]|nr:hypothetical protein AXA65_16680 [Chryseobacterium sp. FP211-J200]